MTDIQSVPFVDLHLQHAQIAAEVATGFDRVLAQGSYILGPEVEAFEKAFAEYSGVEHVVGVGNGTDAIELALVGGGIRPGDEVIIPANTFVATAEAVVRAGGVLRLVDCDDDFLIDVEAVAAAVSPSTRAVIGVHLYGQAAPMELLREAIGSDVLLVEDAAQSQGARRNGVRAGGLADVAGTSFYPGKNLGAYGDGGAVLTSSAEVADHIRALRNHGGVRRYEHLEVGTNSRLDGLQGVVLSAKLARLDEWNQQRRDAAAYYDQLLADVDTVTVPRTVEGNEHVFHLYVIRTHRRDELVTALGAAGIGAGIHYPAPVHRVPAFDFLGLPAGSFPRSEQLATEILSLPIFPGITRAQQEQVVQTLVSAIGG
ncbi:DegT/DnrJ/EryC1/StrS family aminotransferase [soil metagenome]